MKRVANRYIKAVSRDGRLHDRTCERRRTQNETTKTFWLHSFDVDGCDGARDSLPVSRDREPLTSTMAIRILSRISSIDSSSRKKKKKEKRERIALSVDAVEKRYHGFLVLSAFRYSIFGSKERRIEISSIRFSFFIPFFFLLSGLIRKEMENYYI